jgi:hypothetical protein
LARHDGRISAGTPTPLGFEEFVQLIGEPNSSGARGREDAIARYLSAGEGWDEAAKLLGGAFADDVAGLKARKDG